MSVVTIVDASFAQALSVVGKLPGVAIGVLKTHGAHPPGAVDWAVE